jgi:hypothetical protein
MSIPFTTRAWCLGLAGLILLVVGTYVTLQSYAANGRIAFEAMIVAPLPAGTTKAWTAYIDRRIAATLRRGDTTVAVRADIDGFLGYTSELAFGTPFKVSCTREFGGIVSFGTGGDTLKASIFGPTIVEPPAERPPPLGVDPRSDAALELQQQLCTRIDTRIRSAMAR